MMGKMEIRSPPGSRPRDGRHCDLCGCSQPAVRCDKCGCQIFCLSCDDMYHRHPKRRFHLRKAVDPIPAGTQARPVLPVKVAHLNATNPGDPSKMPLPPPRKKKSSLFGSFRKPNQSSDNSPPLPKKEYSWSGPLGSIKKFMSNRPLPPLPTPDDSDGKLQPTTNGQSTRGDFSFIQRRNDERPPQLPQRPPKSPDFPGFNQEKENRIPSSPNNMPGQFRNGSLEPNTIHMNQNHEFSNNEENHWNNRVNNQNGSQGFGTLNRQNHQRNIMPPGIPGYPGGMHQSSSATDLHNMHNAEGMPGAGPVPPHYPHFQMNPHMPPHYPYPMYHPQFPNYPQYFGNSFANLSHPPTSEDLSDSESASKHSSKKQQFRKRAKRSQSVMVDRMAFPGQYFPFGPYPGYGPWGAPMPMEAPPSPASSVRSLTRIGRSRRRKKTTSEDDDEELSVSSSPMSRPKSSSSDPKEHPRAPLATQTTSSEYESDEEAVKRRNKVSTMRRQSEPVSAPSPVKEPNNIAKVKQSSSKQSDSDARGTPEIRSEKRPSLDSTTESPQPVQQKSSAQSVPPDSWECRHCTFVNPIGNRICQVCCKTATPRTETPVTGHSRPSSAAAASRRNESAGSEMETSSPDKIPEIERDVEKRDTQDMASLNSALDEAEKQISRGLEELMKLKDDIDANISKEKPKTSENQVQSEIQENSKPVYKSSGRMRTSILDKLNLNKSQTTNASVSTSTETQTGQSDRGPDKIIQARRHSNSSTTSETYNSPLAQSPDLENNPAINKQKRDSSCQTQQDTIAEYLEKRKAAEEAFLGRPINNFGFGYNDRMDMVTSPLPSMYDRFYGGGFGMMQRSHSRASLFSGRVNDFGPMEYGGPGFGYGPTPMYRSVSRGSLTGEYPDGRMSDFHNLRKPDFYLSMEELVERRRQDNIRAQGLELVRMIREAEQQGFNADDIQVALTHCGKQNPMEWLQENWRNMVDSVLTLSSNYGNDKKENDIGLLSENEARDALRLHKGNIWAAVTECVEGRQRKYLELSARGNFSRQDIVDSLTSSDGDVEMAYAKLTKSTGKPFLMRIWGAGEGVQNQDGARPLTEDFQDGPRMYFKDETVNSDEMSEEIWSEDGEWDEEDVYEEERGDNEELQTCLEDLLASPQEMRTPESDKSDYCDPFPIDDRNASSPSDDIFFVIPEAKPEKKKGFLSKLSAFRRDSKEQANIATSSPEGNILPEESLQPKEDNISQKSNSSSEQPKGNGALSTLKNTLTAIKDTVTGGSKSDKKVPCTQPERRTIIVKGQIDHESLGNSSNDNVQLTSVKSLSEDIVLDQKSTKEFNEPTKSVGDSLKVDEIKVHETAISVKSNFKENNQTSSQAESKNTIETKKPQSLAERLKFAKLTRSSTNLASTSAFQNERSIPEAKLNIGDNIQTNKVKESSIDVNRTSIEIQNENEIKSETLNQSSKDPITSNKVDEFLPVSNNIKQSPPESNATETQNKVVTGDTEISTQGSPSVQPHDVENELKATKNNTSSNLEALSTEKHESTNLKSASQTEKGTAPKTKTKEGTTNKSVTEIRPQAASPTSKSLKDKLVENSLQGVSAKDTNKNNTSKKSNAVKLENETKSDTLKTISSFSDNKTTSEEINISNKIEKKEETVISIDQITPTSLSVENTHFISNKETNLKDSSTKYCNEIDRTVGQISTHLKESDAEINIAQSLNDVVSEDAKVNYPETSLIQKELSSNCLMNENKGSELKTTETEKQIINESQDTVQNIVAHQNLPSEEISLYKPDDFTNASRDLPQNQSTTAADVVETVLKDSKVKSNEITVQEVNESEVSTERQQTAVAETKLASEIISSSKSNTLIENLPTEKTVQNIPENIPEQSATEHLKSLEGFNKNAYKQETLIPQDTSELYKTETINTDQKSSATDTEHFGVSEQMSVPAQTFAHDDISVEAKEPDTKSTKMLETTNKSAEITLNEAGTSTPSDKKTESPSTSTGESDKVSKIGKLKSTKVSKIKKTQNIKNETKDNENTEILKSSFSENKISNVPIENSTKVAAISEGEAALSNETTNDLLENIITTTVAENSKETAIKEKIEVKGSLAESKIATNEITNRTTEGTNVLSESLTIENASEISSNSIQNVPSAIESQSNISTLDASSPSTSKNDQGEIRDISAISKTEQTVGSKETTEISTEAASSTVTVETELKKSEISNKVQNNKNDIVTNASDSSNENTSQDSIKTEAIKDNEKDNFKMMAPVTSSTFPEKSKTIVTPINTTTVPENSKMTEVSSGTTALDNSEVIPTSNSTVPDIANTVASSSSAIPSSSETAEAPTSKSILDKSSMLPTPSNSTAVDASDTKTSESSVIPSNTTTTEVPTSKTIRDNSSVISISSNSTAFDPSDKIASTSSDIPSSSKTIEASTNKATLDNSNVIATSGSSVTNAETLNKINKEIDGDTKSLSVQKQAEQYSMIPDNTTTDTLNKTSSPPSTASRSEIIPIERPASEDNNTLQTITPDDGDDEDDDDSDESRYSNIIPPNPIDTLRNRFEGLSGGTIRAGPIRPASPFRRMSLNSRKQVIALEKKRDTSADKPWFRQKIMTEPVKLPQPKRSIKQQLEMERKVRKIVADRKCRTYRKAEIVVQLMDMNFEEDEAIQAANECSTLEQALSYLQQECLLCTGNFPVSQIISMTHCEHRACRECIRAYFTVQIRDRTILDLLCPFCNEPDIGDEDVAQDYFNHLDIMLKKLVDFEIHELFQRKLRDRVLMKDPNFRWCSQCSSGFISMPNLKRLICPDCNAVTCASCRRLWEKEHQGISCEAFAALKDASDPEAQAAGLAKLLTEDGIDCPSCHFRYALAKGGCMHFRCLQCQHDFCSGCSRPFKMGQKCGVSEFCAKLGLHAHHPRNCLFYLRDKEPEDLQKLLELNAIKYNREPPEGVELKNTCQVMEQKETADGMIDDYCGKEVQDGYAGLCRVHYVEYLGQLVNKYKVDPIQIFGNDDLELVLRRANIRLPPKRYRETDAQYRDKLVNLIQDELPLDKMDGS